MSGSAAILAAHPHPSGGPEPSVEDIAFIRRLAAAGQLLGIELLDHIILGEADHYVSLRERGVLQESFMVRGLHVVISPNPASRARRR